MLPILVHCDVEVIEEFVGLHTETLWWLLLSLAFLNHYLSKVHLVVFAPDHLSYQESMVYKSVHIKCIRNNEATHSQPYQLF